MNAKSSQGVINNLLWKFSERITAQLVTVIVSIVLARILEPSHYGIIAIVLIFITFANVLVSDGLGSALIQKKNVDALDYSSVLFFNFALSLFLYFILFFTAPCITSFYGSGYELLTPVIRVLSLRIILSSVNSVQQAYIAKKMMFKKFFLATLLGTILSAIAGISMAYAGFGVWALVAQYLTNTTVDTIVLFISLKRLPLFRFSFLRLKSLLSFGFQILTTSLLITSYQEIRAVIIGKLYSSSDLAFYDRGKQFPFLIVNNINTSIGAVLFPVMAQKQDSLEAVKTTTRNSIRFSSYLMSPMMLGLAALANPLVSLILTNKWLPCVPLMQLFCIVFLFQPIHTANIQAIKAVGRSDIQLKLEIIKKSIELLSLILVMRISVFAIVISMAILTTLYTFINAFPNIRILNYSFKEQMSDIVPSLSMSLVMFTFVYYAGSLSISNTMVKLLIQVVIGISVYLILSILTRNPQFKYLLSFVRTGINRK